MVRVGVDEAYSSKLKEVSDVQAFFKKTESYNEVTLTKLKLENLRL